MSKVNILDRLRIDEWAIGLTKLQTESLLGGKSKGGIRVTRPPVLWLRKPWFVRYQADPFLLQADGRLFLYYEELVFGSRRGQLRCRELNPDSPVQDLGSRGQLMIRLDCHASYPYVFEHRGVYYCIPETAAIREVSLYHSESPLGPWEKKCILLAGIPARDSTIVLFEGCWWLFCTIAGPDPASLYDNLHIWYSQYLEGPWRPHERCPVKKDARSSRPAGRPIVADGVLYRPAQDCSHRYGARIVINRVVSLSQSDYAEEVVARVEPELRGRYSKGLHTLACAGNTWVVDGNGDRPSLNPWKVSAELFFAITRRLGTLLTPRRGLA